MLSRSSPLPCHLSLLVMENGLENGKEEFMVSCWELIIYGMVSALEFLQCLRVKEVIALLTSFIKF